MRATQSRRRSWRILAGLVCLAAAGYAAPPAAAQVAASALPPAGQARFWFYREFFPNDSGDMPAIALNGAPIGYGLSGANFYRDVPPGRYHLSVASIGMDANQAQDVTVEPGAVVYVKIGSLPSWEEGGGDRGDYRRGTYYVMLMPPQMASLELAQTRYSGGN